jgi:hypothetical protein
VSDRDVNPLGSTWMAASSACPERIGAKRLADGRTPLVPGTSPYNSTCLRAERLRAIGAGNTRGPGLLQLPRAFGSPPAPRSSLGSDVERFY